MSIDEIVRAWKADEELAENNCLKNPVGEELSEEELEQVAGAGPCTLSCWNVTCGAQVTG